MSCNGAFHGMIAPTTPTGSRTSRPKPGPDGCTASSNGNVSASAAYDSRPPAAIIPDHWAIAVQGARLARPHLAERVVALHQRRREGAQVLGALGVGEAGPRALVERGAGGLHGSGHVGGLGLGNREVHLLGPGVDHVDRRVGRRRHPFDLR